LHGAVAGQLRSFDIADLIVDNNGTLSSPDRIEPEVRPALPFKGLNKKKTR
jgi:hypothetical protein